MKLEKYTKAELKELLSEATPKYTKELQVLEVELAGKLTPTKELNLLEEMEKLKFSTQGNSLNTGNIIVIFKDTIGIENSKIQEIIKHNENELKLYNERKLIVEEKTAYVADISVELPELSLSDFRTKHDVSNTNRNLRTMVKESMKYDEYLDDPSIYSKVRANFDIDVDFQRPSVWSLDMKQRLILTILKGMPIGTFYYNQINYYTVAKELNVPISEVTDISDVIYDGKQRLSAIISFIKGEFPVNINGQDYYYHNMKLVFERALDQTVSVVETAIENKKDLIEYYLEINTLKVHHDESAINHAKSVLESL